MNQWRFFSDFERVNEFSTSAHVATSKAYKIPFQYVKDNFLDYIVRICCVFFTMCAWWVCIVECH